MTGGQSGVIKPGGNPIRPLDFSDPAPKPFNVHPLIRLPVRESGNGRVQVFEAILFGGLFCDLFFYSIPGGVKNS